MEFQSSDCRASELTVFVNPSTPRRYCGSYAFTEVSDGQTLLVRFRNEFNSRGARYYCSVTAVIDDENCNCGWKKAVRKNFFLQISFRFFI